MVMNWKKLFETKDQNEYLVNDLKDFARGHWSKHDIEGYVPKLRPLIRSRGTEKARELTRRALRDRGYSL
jgi:glycerol-3-phosphate dehydrogenase